MTNDDRRLVAALREGDAGAFATLVDRHSRAMLHVARAYVPSRAAAEEVVQETWIGVIRGLDGFEGRSSLKTWIFRILVHVAMRSGARERRSMPFSALAEAEDRGEPAVDPDRFLPADHDRFPGHWAMPPARWVTPEEGLLAGEVRDVVVRAIAELPASQRTVIALRDIEGWSSEEVAEALEISAGNQRLLLHRARSRVRAAIERYYDVAAEPVAGTEPTPRRALTVLTLAVPALSADLRPTSTELLWIVDVYGFLVAGFLITMGTLGDRIGRRRLLLIGAAAFGVASVVAALSSSPEMLIASRAVLGIAGATLAPSTLSLIRNMFHDDRQRTVAIGIWVTSFSVGAAIGPLVGGVLLESFHWGSVFLLAVPVMALLLAIGPRLLPEYKDPSPGRLDLFSAALSLAAVLAVIGGVKAVATGGLAVASAALAIAGLAVGAAFVVRQCRLPDPMIDLSLFRRRAFSLALGANTLGFAVVFGLEVFVAQYLQLVLGYSPLEAGLWSVPGAAAFVVGSQLTPPLAARLGSAVTMLGGTVVAAAGVAALVLAGAADGPGPVVSGVVVLSLGLAPLFTLAADLAVGSAPPERAGAASGISETSSELGGALGLALLGTIGTAVYRGRTADAMPADLPAKEAATASDTLGGAVEVADRLPAGLAAQVLEPAREAFTQALQVAATVSGVLVVAAAILVARLLRPGGQAGRWQTASMLLPSGSST